jgi:hypothetical protein
VIDYRAVGERERGRGDTGVEMYVMGVWLGVKGSSLGVCGAQ